VLKSAAQRSGEEWEVIEFPAILPSGNPYGLQFWSKEELEALREELPNSKWQAQYQQNPIGNESALLSEIGGSGGRKTIHLCDYILQSWDTAFEKTSVLTIQPVQRGVSLTVKKITLRPTLFLLNTYKKRVEFPELKARCAQRVQRV
jgi:hypothetical protein